MTLKDKTVGMWDNSGIRQRHASAASPLPASAMICLPSVAPSPGTEGVGTVPHRALSTFNRPSIVPVLLEVS